MSEQEQSQRQKEKEERVESFMRYIEQMVKDTRNAVQLAESLFRVATLMSTRKDVRKQIEEILHRVEATKTDMGPKKHQSSFDLDLAEVLSKTKKIPLKRLREQIHSEFFHLMKMNSVELTRNFRYQPATKMDYIKHVLKLYKEQGKTLPTTATQILTFAKNCRVPIHSKEQFSAIAQKMSEIEYFGAILSTDHKLFFLYETNIGTFLVH